jgi:WD40 repeat protein
MKVSVIRKDCCKSRQLIHSGWIQSVAISPNTANSRVQKLASVDRSGFVHIHSIRGNHELELLRTYNDGLDLAQIDSVCWTSDSQIAFGGSNVILILKI